jgi:Uma2 family endonuclease
MTTKRVAAPQPGAPDILKFPDPPPEELTAYYRVNYPGYPGSLAAHFGSPETTIITSEIAAALIPTESYEGVRYPDLLIAFNADLEASLTRNGYLIPEQGKPPDFVLEVASESTGRRDETIKRDDYAAMGVPEYWRFDHTGGRFHRAHLAGDRLVDGRYQPIPISRSDEGHFWGRSLVLNLDLCWEAGKLRFWDPVGRSYLTTYEEEHAARRAAEAARQAAEAARDAAEARIRRLEEELRRRPNP